MCDSSPGGWKEIMKLSTNQFLVVLLINVLFLLAFAGHYFSETVRTVTQTQTHTVYKFIGGTKYVTINDCTITNMMQAASTICTAASNTGLSTFKIDSNGKPVFLCNH